MRKNIENILVRKRKEKNMTQQQVAKKIGVSLSSIAMWERQERNIKQKYIAPLCKTLDITEEELKTELSINYAFVWQDRFKEIKEQSDKEINNVIKDLKKIKNKHLKIIDKIDKYINIFEED